MAKIKDNSGEKTYILTEREYSYLQILNLALQYNVFKDKVVSGFLYYVCNNRFGYTKDVNLLFEVDLEDKKRELKVKELPPGSVDNLRSTIDKA